MKNFICSALLFSYAFSYVVEMRYNGTVVGVKDIAYDGRYVKLNGKMFLKDSIKSIIFTYEPKQTEKTKSLIPETKEIIEDSKIAEQKWKDAGALVLLDEGKFILYEDGTREYIYHAKIKILKEKRKNWATINLYVNEENSKVEVLFGRTIKPDGRIINLSKKDIKVIKPRREDIVFFGKGKWISFTLPMVEKGDIIEYSYRRYTFNPWSREIFSGGWYFQGEEPYILSRVEVEIPLKDTLVWKIKNAPLECKPIIKIENKRKTYIWEFKNIPPIIPEPNMPPLGDIAVRLEFSNQSNWNKIFEWYAKYQKERMKVTPSIKRIADSLVKNAKTIDDTIANIYHWVQRNIRYISIKGAASSGVSGHSADYTLKVGYGDCTDNAILFSTLLKAVGIEAYPVYVGTNDEEPELIPEVPSLYGNHAITEIFVNDSSFYLDATGDFSRYPSFWGADHGVYAVNALKRKIEKIPVPPPQRNLRKYLYSLTVDNEGNLSVKFESSYTGDYESGVRGYWATRSKKDIPILMQQMVTKVSANAELKDYQFINLYEISKPFKMKINYEIKNWVRKVKEIYLLKLPEIPERYRFPEVSLSKRNYPLAYETSTEITHRVEIKIPPEMEVEYLPSPLHLKIKHAEYTAVFKKQKRKIVFEDDFKRKDRIIPVSDYIEYKKMCESIMNYFKKPIILSRR